MTAIICFNWNMGAIFVADSRILYPGPSGEIVTVRDVCQKLWVPNGWSVLGLAGDLCMGNSIAASFYRPLHAQQKWSITSLLTDDNAMREVVTSALATHPDELGEGHAECVTRLAGLLIAYVGLVRHNKPNREFDHNELGVLTVRITTDLEIQRSGLGPEVLGDGADAIKHELTLERVTTVANAGKPEQQALMALLFTSGLLNQYKTKSAGLPLQVVHIDPKGVTITPYFYWVDITKRFGTYVAMRIEDGNWVQEHRPTKTKRLIRRPSEILNQEIDEGPWPLHKAEMFDPRMSLTNGSPGVIRKNNPNLMYATYNPRNVQKAIVESWGDEPIELLTWAQSAEGVPAKPP